MPLYMACALQIHISPVFMWLMVNVTFLPSQGRLDEGGGPDYLDASQQGRDAQFTDKRDAWQSPYMATAHPSGEGEWPGLLYVSDQHQRHEEASRLCRRSW